VGLLNPHLEELSTQVGEAHQREDDPEGVLGAEQGEAVETRKSEVRLGVVKEAVNTVVG